MRMVTAAVMNWHARNGMKLKEIQFQEVSEMNEEDDSEDNMTHIELNVPCEEPSYNMME